MFFHALTFAGFRGNCLNMRLLGQVLKHLPRDPASVNAMKQTCVILHILPDSNSNPAENTAKTLNYHFSYTGFLQIK